VRLARKSVGYVRGSAEKKDLDLNDVGSFGGEKGATGSIIRRVGQKRMDPVVVIGERKRSYLISLRKGVQRGKEERSCGWG